MTLSGLLLGALLGIGQAQPAEPRLIGLEPLSRLDLLPRFRIASSVGAVTSYDRSGGNDDGFSGKYSYLRKEGDALVLADLEGPGCIYRIHTPTPTDDPIEFYIDGESSPRIRMPFRQLFTGGAPPFVRPLADSAGGGFYSYVPISYRKSCKVLLRGKQLQFYDLNYATYPAGTPIESFSWDAATWQPQLADAIHMLLNPRSAPTTAGSSSSRTQRVTRVVRPGKSVTLFESRRGGRIQSLRLGPASAFVGKERSLLLRVTWDGAKEPAILCPAGDFFGYAWGQPAMRSALLGTDEGGNYCRFPMPFDRSAKVELVSLDGTASSRQIDCEFVVESTPRRKDEGKFYVRWNRENPAKTGEPFTFLETAGRGHLVGLSLQAQGKTAGSTEFFEGDDQTTIDGELVVHGTGSEDFFNGGWYDVPGRWDGQVSRPLSGCLAYQRPIGRTGGYRFLISDAYSFSKSIRQTIEHGPVGNAYPTDYCGTAYFYLESPPNRAQRQFSLSELCVEDPKEVVFAADWTLPIASFAFADATVSRRAMPTSSGAVRCLSFRPKQLDDFFGSAFLAFNCDLPAEGVYDVFADAISGPDSGRWQLFQDEAPTGDPVNLFAASATITRRIRVGQISAKEGSNKVLFKALGKDAGSAGLGLDLINLTFVRRGASR